MNTRHNCCKVNDFDWKSIDPLGNSADRLVCNICKREFIDTIFIKREDKLLYSYFCNEMDWEALLRKRKELIGDLNE